MPSYKLNAQDYVLEEFDGDFVVLNLKSGVYFEVAERAADLLRCIMAGACPVKTIDQLAAVRPDAVAPARAAFDHLLEASVIVPVGDAGDAPPPEPAQLAALAAGGAFICEGFDDLQSLILADPVHDVDLDTGRLLWPQAGVN